MNEIVEEYGLCLVSLVGEGRGRDRDGEGESGGCGSWSNTNRCCTNIMMYFASILRAFKRQKIYIAQSSM